MNKNIKQLILSVSLLSTIFFINGCSSVYDKHVQWQRVKPENFPVIFGVGYAPISLQKSAHETQRMLMAINASKLAAYAELAEQVHGQRISSSMTVADLLMENNQLSSSVQGLIRGATVVKSYSVGDIYTTELQLNFENVYQLYLANLNRKAIKSVKYY
jgi:hypothetical protein|tara:strand:+ start:275 stop:751 length:477 start_codon:yes stop_codon:yes gene_type:complete